MVIVIGNWILPLAFTLLSLTWALWYRERENTGGFMNLHGPLNTFLRIVSRVVLSLVSWLVWAFGAMSDALLPFEELRALREQNMKQAEIASLFGVSVAKVSNEISRYGLTRRRNTTVAEPRFECISPAGEVHRVGNLAAFCAERGLNPGRMSQLTSHPPRRTAAGPAVP